MALNNNPAERAKANSQATQEQRKQNTNYKGSTWRKIKDALGIDPESAQGKVGGIAATSLNGKMGNKDQEISQGNEKDYAPQVLKDLANEASAAANNIPSSVSGINKVEPIKEEKAEYKEPAEKTIGTDENIETSKNDKVEEKSTAKTMDDSYNEYERDILETQGLGKYIDKDGKVDYKKLQRSKVGYGILNALAGAVAGAGAGAANQAAPDMSKGILGQEIEKRNKAVSDVQEAKRSKLKQDENMDTFVKQLHLQGAENERVQKALAGYMSNLNFNDQKRLMQWLAKQPITDAMKVSFVQNPAGYLSMGMKAIGSSNILGSDNNIKKFATKKVFK